MAWLVRVAVLESDRCRPKDCNYVCYRFCPMVRTRVNAIEYEEGKKPRIVEALCTGCGICVKKCPFGALSIVNLPDELEEECSHRFGPNTFKLYRLPAPSPGQVLGLLGKNGIGKTTSLKILSGEIQPNLGRFNSPPSWDEVIKHFRGSALQPYFQRLSRGKLRVVHKPQYVDKIPKAVRGKVGDLLARVDERGKLSQMVEVFGLAKLLDRDIGVLSGGELQLVAIAAAMCREADVYIFDEPSSYLDVKQRLVAARAIRSLKDEGKTVIVAEHDLAVLDYLSDQICVFYGEPGVYGIVSPVYGVRVGINVYLDGYLPSDNVRFRSEPIRFPFHPPTAVWQSKEMLLWWGSMEKSYDFFRLEVEEGSLHKGEVVGILGPNGIGKTTFVKLIAGLEKPDQGEAPVTPGLEISYKPQYLSGLYEGVVEHLLREAASGEFGTSWYRTEILGPLGLEKLLDRDVSELSGGELQKVAIAICLSKKADIYLLDEPSAYLDVEERLAVARVIRRVVETREASALVVEHDVSAQDFIADRLMVFSGEPGVRGYAKTPVGLREGMNEFLSEMDVTFRRDLSTGRPRVNKLGSRLDQYQKSIGEYYYIPAKEEEEE